MVAFASASPVEIAFKRTLTSKSLPAPRETSAGRNLISTNVMAHSLGDNICDMFGGAKSWSSSSPTLVLPRNVRDGEQKVIERMRQLRAEGLGLHVIAARLNEQGTPPRSGARWHAATVSNLLGDRSAALDHSHFVGKHRIIRFRLHFLNSGLRDWRGINCRWQFVESFQQHAAQVVRSDSLHDNQDAAQCRIV